MPSQGIPRTVAVIGGGFSGSLLALRLSRLRPGWMILLVEKQSHPGRGLAYGACEPYHLLNVPVSRMDIGLIPEFSTWLPGRSAALAEALAESHGELANAFVPRHLFGDYIEQYLQAALSRASRGGIRRVHGEAMAVSASPRTLHLDDGRSYPVDMAVIATGNEPSVLPFAHEASSRIIDDPWRAGALDDIPGDGRILLVGASLTMVDIVLSLRARGHRGTIQAISRHGLLPRVHRAGGAWQPFLQAGISPLKALKIVRAHVHAAEARDIPWQRVLDAVRPAVASIWHGWSLPQRAQFLRHLRSIWDVHRHRMTARIGQLLETAMAEGRVRVSAGRIQALHEEGAGLRASILSRGGAMREERFDLAINCTGPQADIRRTRQPLLQTLQRQGLVRPDALGLGLESEDCAVLDADGKPSSWLFALGPLTRPAWWEITSVPEIRIQVERLARKIADELEPGEHRLPAEFLNIGAGI